MYVIKEKTYEDHIDGEVHLYELPHHLTFLARKDKDRWDMENLIKTASGMVTSPIRCLTVGTSPAAT